VVLPSIAFNTFAARFKEPQAEEGFEEILKVDFTFQGTDEAKEAWKRFWF
jgi:bifunctional polynucleotide phosphatase/kinase